jgi:hypothetical protein
MKKKSILLTYDYELFLGVDSGDIYNTLISPTNKILKMLKRYDSNGLFFIDASFLIAIEKLDCFDIVKQQIQAMVRGGFDIGLHIHPHWEDAVLTGECRWKFEEYEHFRLHSYSDEELKTIVRSSYDLLSKIVLEVNLNYKIDTFRAGGWSIQPFDKLAPVFKEIGIKYDFSVLPGMKDDDMPKHYYDFTVTPKDKYIWRFGNNVTEEDDCGDFIEISNTIFGMNIVDLIKNRKSLRGCKIAGDGKGAGKKRGFLEQLQRVRWNNKQIVSSDSIELNFFKKYIRKIDKKVIVSASHPKLFSDNSFDVLEYTCSNFNCIRYKDINIDD